MVVIIKDYILPLLVGLVSIIVAIATTTGTGQIILWFSLGLYLITTILSYIIKKVINGKSVNQIDKVLNMLQDDITAQRLAKSSSQTPPK